MAVPFSISGSLTINTEYDGTSRSGILSVFDLETETVKLNQSFNINSPSININYNLENMHTSKDVYNISTAAFGYIGESRNCSGLSPTIPIMYETFVHPYYPEEGTQLLYEDFETGSSPSLALSGLGTGITYSGIVNISSFSDKLQGNYAVVQQSSSDSSTILTSNSPTTSGLLKGRTIFCLTAGTDTSSEDQAVGFAFLRQGPNLTDNCYKVYFTQSSTSGRYSTHIARGALANASTGSMRGSGTIMYSHELDFFSSTTRNQIQNKRYWLIVEWAVDVEYYDNIKIATYYKKYEPEDTINSVRSNATLLRQQIYCGETNGADLYTDTEEQLCWIINSDSSKRLSIDNIYVEEIDNVTDRGIFNKKLKVFQGTIGSAERPYVFSLLTNNGVVTGPEGSVVRNEYRPLIDIDRAYYGVKGYGYGGMSTISRTSASLGSFISYLVDPDNPIGLKKGVFRFAVGVRADSGMRFGFSFLSQGSVFNSNCYTVEFYRNAANQYRVRVRKGSIITTPLTSTAPTFAGTILATSSNLTGLLDNTRGWVEIRWWARDVSTEIDICYTKVIEPSDEGSLYVDHSPGNVDHRLSSVLSVTDASSPYLSTNEPTIITQVAYSSSAFYIEQMELRGAKIGN